MRKIHYLFSGIILLLSACSTPKPMHEVSFVSETATDSVKMELFLPEKESLNVFYDFCVDDSFLYGIDFYNDSVLKIYPLIPNPSLIGYATKGQGPDDIIFPIFTREISLSKKTIRMVIRTRTYTH